MRLLVIGAHLERGDVEPAARAIAAGDLFLSAVEIDDDRPLGDRELLLRVAEVRRALLERATFVAVRYGFAAASESDAASRAAQFAERWRELLARHREHVEMTLKIAAASPAPRPDRHAFRSGAEYLKALQSTMRAVEVDPAFRVDVEASIVPFAREHRWITRDTGTVELATIVHKADVHATYTAGEGLRSRHPHVPFLLSGPWPLEVFAE